MSFPQTSVKETANKLSRQVGATNWVIDRFKLKRVPAMIVIDPSTKQGATQTPVLFQDYLFPLLFRMRRRAVCIAFLQTCVCMCVCVCVCVCVSVCVSVCVCLCVYYMIRCPVCAQTEACSLPILVSAVSRSSLHCQTFAGQRLRVAGILALTTVSLP